MTDAAEAFWSYAVVVYGRAREACIALQDGHRLDINILLFCCWAATRGKAVGRTELIAVEAAVRLWRTEVVTRLRAARRWMKDKPEPGGNAELRVDILAAELTAERIEQRLILAAVPSLGEQSALAADCGSDCAADNLNAYAAVEGLQRHGEAVPLLTDLVLAAFPEAGRAAIVARLKEPYDTSGETS